MASNIIEDTDVFIGEGSCGRVYRTIFQQKECVKKIFSLLHVDTREESSKKFIKEIDALLQLKNDNIVKYFEQFEYENRQIGLIMECCDENLTTYITRHSTSPFPYHIEVNFSLQIAEGVKYLHQNSIVHGRLSSNNVLVIFSRDGKVILKISDYGIFRMEYTNSLDSPASTAKSDVFSCGILMVQILTRQMLQQAQATLQQGGAAYLHLLSDIEDAHSLKEIAEKCLEEEEYLLSSNKLFMEVKALRAESSYIESLTDDLQNVSRIPHVRSVKLNLDVHLAIVGQSFVGKTTLIKAFQKGFSKDEPPPFFKPTVAVDFYKKSLIYEDYTVNVTLWDTAGFERFDIINSVPFRKAEGVLILYDVTEASSFHKLSAWIERVKEKANREVKITIIGNKRDKVDERQVSVREGKEFAEQHGYNFLETSCYESIDEVIHKIVGNLLKTHSNIKSRQHREITTIGMPPPRPVTRKNKCNC